MLGWDQSIPWSSPPLCVMTSQCASEGEPQHTPYCPVLGRQAQTQYVSPWVTVLQWDFPTWSGKSTTFACSCATRTSGGNQKAWVVACPQFEHMTMDFGVPQTSCVASREPFQLHWTHQKCIQPKMRCRCYGACVAQRCPSTTLGISQYLWPLLTLGCLDK